MTTLIRLDKYLADLGIGTRSEVKIYIRKGRVTVDGIKATSSDMKISTDAQVVFDGKQLEFELLEYYMLNKPAGVVSATMDNFCTTVVDLIEEGKKKELFPVGRLDKDTEGLLIITNDGDLAHKLLSPKKHVPKVYFAKINGRITEEDTHAFREGIELGDFKAMPAEITILESAEESLVEITIFEGKFHQVKRMFEALGKEVLYLKRLSMGELKLDESLEVSQYRKLTNEELLLLKK
ncbi:MAG: pseudouridine synthase [Anaerocolumna sp.]|jgi:16S rRNA pseudouridine516 synthase|nr:pseudouridine synthase [Anaerocolumna sp.]